MNTPPANTAVELFAFDTAPVSSDESDSGAVQTGVSRPDEVTNREAERPGVGGEIGDGPVNPEARLRQAEEALGRGDIASASQILESLKGHLSPECLKKAWGQIVDEAVLRGTSGSRLLPKEFRKMFQQVVKAFRNLARGSDEATLALIHPIGRHSPFADWKLMVRGLSAYVQKDDSRALENWSRLDPSRVAARLVAPFRLQIDGAFADSQPPTSRQRLQELSERLHSCPILADLQQLQARLSRCRRGLRPVWSVLRKLVPRLREANPEWFRRLQRILYWEIIERGLYEDLRHFDSLFGPLPDDPANQRLLALIMERCGQLQVANSHWQSYLEQQGYLPGLSIPDLRRLKALIWSRMAENELRLLHDVSRKQSSLDLPTVRRYLDDLRRNHQALAVFYFRQAIQADSTWLEPRRRLIRALDSMHRRTDAFAELTRLLEMAPDDLSALALAALWSEEVHDFDRAVHFWNRAIEINPLNIELPRRRLRCVWRKAFHLARSQQMDDACATVTDSITLVPTQDSPYRQGILFLARLCQGDSTESLREAILSHPLEVQIVIAGWLAFWTEVLEMATPIRRIVRRLWRERLAQSTFSAAELLALADLWHTLSDIRDDSSGASPDDAMVRTCIERNAAVLREDMQRLELGMHLSAMKWFQELERLAKRWQQTESPSLVPQILLLEALIGAAKRRMPRSQLRPIIEELRTMWSALPPGPLRDALQKHWERLRRAQADSPRESGRVITILESSWDEIE